MTPGKTLLPLVFLSLAAALRAAEAPANLRVAFPLLASNSIELSWHDRSDDEERFDYELSTNDGASWISVGSTRANQTLTSTLKGYQNGATLHFRVRAISTASGNSEWSTQATKTFPATNEPPIWIRSGTFHGGTAGTPLTIDPPTVYGAAPTEFSAIDLPPGTTLDSDTGVISGTPTTPGVFRPILTVTEGSFTASTFITLRIQPALSGPTEDHPLPTQLAIASGDPATVDLREHFSDPDVGEAVRIETNLGGVDTILHSSATPASVENFLNYVDRGSYDDSVFHRSAVTATSGVDVVQGGLLQASGDDYASFPKDPNVVDEPGLSNLTGSFAMAKTDSPNSGSSQWYFNVIDNTNLDGPQSNGGYTVFGRAATPCLPVVATMHEQDRGTYPVTIDGDTISFKDWPITTTPAGASPTPQESILISSVTRIEPLSYTIESNSSPGLVSAAVRGTELTLRGAPAARGTSTISLGVRDLDLNTLPATATVRVLHLDLETAFSPAGKFAITFNHEKSIPGLAYEVQRSSDLKSWAAIWRTSDGFGASEVIDTEDLGAEWRLTIEDPLSLPPATTEACLRVVATLSP